MRRGDQFGTGGVNVADGDVVQQMTAVVDLPAITCLVGAVLVGQHDVGSRWPSSPSLTSRRD